MEIKKLLPFCAINHDGDINAKSTGRLTALTYRRMQLFHSSSIAASVQIDSERWNWSRAYIRRVPTSAMRGFGPGDELLTRSHPHDAFATSCRWLSKQSAAGKDGKANDRTNNASGAIGVASPLNQRATNAILSQLSSPPNLLTLSRMIATPYLSYLLVSHHNGSDLGSGVGEVVAAVASTPLSSDTTSAPETFTATADTISTISTSIDWSSTPVVALSLFLVMGFTDFLDGYIARTFPSTATVLGTYLDPFADKFFISTISLTLWYTGSLPGMLVVLWVARDVGMVGSVYWLVKQETLRKQHRKTNNQHDSNAVDSDSIAVMDPQNTPLKVKASTLSKINTTLQIGLIALGIAGEVPAINVPPELMTSLVWITAGTTIGSSLGYLGGSALKKSGNK